MPRVCTICQHKARSAIDKAIISRQSNRSIAAQFAVSRTSVQRHKGHVSRTIVKAAERREENLGGALLQQMRDLLGEARGLLTAMKRKKDYRGAVAGVRATTEVLSELDRMLQRAFLSGAVAGPHASPCPHCDSGEFQRLMFAAVARALGKGPLVPIHRPDTRSDSVIDLDVLPQPGEYAALPADSETGELPVLPDYPGEGQVQ